MIRYSVIVSLFLVLSTSASAELLKTYASHKPGFEVHRLFQIDGQGLWGFDFFDSQNVIVTMKTGDIYRVDLTTRKKQRISGGPNSVVAGQGGLMDVRLHPQFKSNQWVYFTYTKKIKNKYTTAVARGKLSGNAIKELKDLFVAKPAYSETHHFGSRLAFDRQGHIFFTVGDRGNRDKAQSLATHNGKVMRLKDDGAIPKDNPFAGKNGALPEIWSYGHRNPQGLTMHPQKQDLWEMEHGPRGGDEINLVKKGQNYGWPIVTHGKEYWGPSIGEGASKPGMKPPVKFYVPSIAPSGLDFYLGDVFPQWKDSLFSGALKLTHLNRVKIKNGKAIEEERLLQELNRRVRHVRAGPDGLLYLSTDKGELLQLRPVSKAKTQTSSGSKAS